MMLRLTVEEVARDVELHGADLALGRVEGDASEFRHARRVGHVHLKSWTQFQALSVTVTFLVNRKSVTVSDCHSIR